MLKNSFIFLLACLWINGCVYSGSKREQNNVKPSELVRASAVAVSQPSQKKQSRKKVTFEEGFKKLKWGDSPAKNLTRINQDTQDQEITAYTHEGERPRVFGLHTGMVIYYFKNNQLFKLETLWQPNEEEYQDLKKDILEEYGDADEVTLLDSYRWEKSDRHLSFLFSNINATRASSEGYFMSLVVEKRDF